VTVLLPCVHEVPIVAVEGELDPPAIITLQRRITAALGVGRGFAVLDLRAATMPPGQTLSLFAGALRRVSRHGTRLAITGAQPSVQRVLDRGAIAGVELHPTPHAALAAAGRAHDSSGG
jgi:anti-anti-sigma factor